MDFRLIETTEGVKMGHKSRTRSEASEKVVKAIRHAICSRYNAEEKIRIVPEGLRGGLFGKWT